MIATRCGRLSETLSVLFSDTIGAWRGCRAVGSMDVSGCRRQCIAALVLFRLEEEGHSVGRNMAQSSAVLRS